VDTKIEAEVEKQLAARVAVTRIGVRDLERRFGLHRRSIWSAIRRGDFPEGAILFGQKRTWLLSEIEAFEVRQAARPQLRGDRNLTGGEAA
jgi:predicted DNA-binding transcriptional regulator AlpA